MNEYAEKVKSLGETIGYGMAMQLCEELWGDMLERELGKSGGQQAVYCAVSMLVPCYGCEPARRLGSTCDWCCGAGRVTRKVSECIVKWELEGES